MGSCLQAWLRGNTQNLYGLGFRFFMLSIPRKAEFCKAPKHTRRSLARSSAGCDHWQLRVPGLWEVVKARDYTRFGDILNLGLGICRVLKATSWYYRTATM